MLAKFVLIVASLAAFSSPVLAQHKITITRVESLRAVPSGSISRDALEIIPGTTMAPADSKPMRPIPEYVYSSRAGKNIPLPSPNPLGVSFCDVDIYPFED